MWTTGPQACRSRHGVSGRFACMHMHSRQIVDTTSPRILANSRCSYIRYSSRYLAMDTSPESRSQKIVELTDLVYDSLDLEYIKTTGSLFASKSLRHSTTRKQLGFMKQFQYEGRLLTEKVTTCVVKRLLDQKSLELPAYPGFSKRAWVKESAQLLLTLLQKARRSYSSMADSMDGMDTQPWQLDPEEDSIHRCHILHI